MAYCHTIVSGVRVLPYWPAARVEQEVAELRAPIDGLRQERR